jgi:L-fuconolactonase
MKIIDTHCHASRIWYEPLDGLLHQMDQNQVEQAVLIQIFNEYDNAYNFECVRQHPDRLCVVALVDVNRATAGDELERLERLYFLGIGHVGRVGMSEVAPNE